MAIPEHGKRYTVVNTKVNMKLRIYTWQTLWVLRRF